ncbi:MAG: glycosyltransferase family 4 protein, partial [Mycoplasma sp.]
VIYSNGFCPGILNNKRNKKTRNIYVQHCDSKIYFNLLYKQSVIQKFFLKLLNIKITENDHFVCFNEESSREIFKTENLNSHNIHISPYSKIEIDNFYNSRVNLDCEDITYIGRISNEKNIRFLSKLSDELSNKRFIKFYGNGELMSEYSHKNNFYGSVNSEQLESIYSKTKLLILASEFEGFPLVLCECLSYGIPIICLNSFTNAKYFIGNNERGFLIDELSIEKFREKIDKIFNISKEEYLKLSQKCYEFSLENFEKDNFINKWYNLINSLTE